MTASWPTMPTEGEMVVLPLPCPPMLLAAAGCPQAGTFVVLWWGGGARRELLWADASGTGTGHGPAWQTLTRHNPLCRILFEPYRVEDDPADPCWNPPHRLVVDVRSQVLAIALREDAELLLALEARAGHQAAAVAPLAGAVRRLGAWLDETLDWVDTGADPDLAEPRAATA